MKALLFSIAFLPWFFSKAQNTALKYSFGSSLAIGIIKGESETYGLRPGVGIFCNRSIGKRLQIGFELNKMQYQGTVESVKGIDGAYVTNTEKYHHEVNTASNQLCMNIGFNIIPKGFKGFHSYVQTGFGIAGVRSSSYFQDMRDSLGGNKPNPNFQQWTRETYEGRFFFVPIGFSLGYEIKNQFFIDFGVQCLITRNDDIDLINTTSFSNRHFDIPVNFLLRFGYLL